jgi:hypothetical protein
VLALLLLLLRRRMNPLTRSSDGRQMIVTSDHSRRLADLHRRWTITDEIVGAVARVARRVTAAADVVEAAGHADSGTGSGQLRQHMTATARVLEILTQITLRNRSAKCYDFILRLERLSQSELALQHSFRRHDNLTSKRSVGTRKRIYKIYNRVLVFPFSHFFLRFSFHKPLDMHRAAVAPNICASLLCEYYYYTRPVESNIIVQLCNS